jgi:hypothetical protein
MRTCQRDCRTCFNPADGLVLVDTIHVLERASYLTECALSVSLVCGQHSPSRVTERHVDTGREVLGRGWCPDTHLDTPVKAMLVLGTLLDVSLICTSPLAWLYGNLLPL